MKPKTFFEVRNEDDIRQAHKKWDCHFKLECDIRDYKKGNKYFKCDYKGDIFIALSSKEQLLNCGYTEILNPFTEVEAEEVKPEFPCEMYVWDDEKDEKHKLEVVAYIPTLEYPYIVKPMLDRGYGVCIGYKHAKPIPKEDDFKIGDWVVITKFQGGATTNSVVQINEIRDSGKIIYYFGDYYFGDYLFGADKGCYRKAKPEEIPIPEPNESKTDRILSHLDAIANLIKE